MSRIRKAIIQARINPERLYSKAEDVALKMRQLKNIGSDARRHFIKQGVTKEELEELGLNELFEQRRVTQAEILQRIRENEIRFEEEIAYGGRASDVDFEVTNPSFEEYYGPETVEFEIDYQVDEHLKDFYSTLLGRMSPEDMTPTEQALARWAVLEELERDELPMEIQEELRESALNNIRIDYEMEPAEIVQLVIDGSPVEGYTLIKGPYDEGYLPNERIGSSDYVMRDFGMGRGMGPEYQDLSVRSSNEAQVRLRALATEMGDLDAVGDARWAEYTLPGGTNYREIRYRLEGPEKFREFVHFPSDINNVFHARVTDRVDTKGNNVLFVEELQSDWAQQGRKSGFADPKVLAEGEDNLRRALDVNKIPEALERFYDSHADPNQVPTVLLDVYDASAKNIPFRDKIRHLAQFVRDYNRIVFNNTRGLFVETVLDKLSDAEKFELAETQIANANRYVGGSSLNPPYRMPDPNNDLGRAEIDTLARAQVEARYRILADRTADGVPPFYIQKIVMDHFNDDDSVTNARQAAKLFLRELEDRARNTLNLKFQEANLPNRFAEGVEESLDSLKPGLVDSLKSEAQKPQAAPFVRDSNAWNKLAIKRLINIAAEEGYDKVMFTPSEVQLRRWGEQGLVGQYDVNIPKAIKQVTGSKPGQTTISHPVSEGIYASDNLLTGPSIDLNQKTPTGETVAERAKAGQTMFAVPLAIGAAGLAGLAAPDMAQAGEVPIEEGIGQLPRRTSGERGLLEEVGDFVRYGPGVGLDAFNAMILRPVAGSLAGRTAFTLGMDPETIRDAQSRVESLVDYKASPGEEAYGQRILSGIADLLESDTAQTAAPYVMPTLEALEDASQRVTSGILGLNERLYGDEDDPERTDALLETIRPGIEAIQPI